MPNTLAKNLNLCLSLIKQRPQSQITLSPHHPFHNQQHYNSLYEEEFKPLPMITISTSYVSAPSSPSAVSTDYMETKDDLTSAIGLTTLDLTAAYASHRFFISSPGHSNSIVDSLSSSSNSNLLLSPPAEEEAAAVAGGVPVQTYSPDPYVDFRRSMQEMVEARDLGNLDVKEAWDYLQELLLTYLDLNPKNAHKYIVGAFTDLVLNLMSPNNHTRNHNIDHNTNHNPSSSSFSSSSGNESGYVLS